MSMDTPMIRDLEHFLSMATSRQKLIAGNMANIDTPGYRTQDIDFESEMSRVLNQDGSAAPASMGPVPHDVPGLIERPDGNNVSLEREGMAMAETQLEFRAGVQLLRDQFHQLLTAINEGKA